jgi:hypothetical protein
LTVQLHDYTPGIAPSGLFWTVRVPDNAVRISNHAATIRMDHVRVTDSFSFLGPVEVPASASFGISWEATGPVRHLVPGSDDPTDPTNLSGTFRDARATGTFSARSITQPGGVPFSIEGAPGVAVWAELGKERNGRFVK